MDKIIDWVDDYILELPFKLTENSRFKLIRIIGILLSFVYLPLAILIFGLPYLLLVLIQTFIEC
jgi:hypothetical protein